MGGGGEADLPAGFGFEAAFSGEARYFYDVAENFPVERSSNRDLFDLFEMLHSYIDIESPEN